MGHKFVTAAALALIVAACSGVPKNRSVAPGASKPLGPAPTSFEGGAPTETTVADEPSGEVTAGVESGVLPGSVPEGASPVVVAAPTADESPSLAVPSTGDPSQEPSGTGNVSWPKTLDKDDTVTVAVVGGRSIDLRELVSKWMLRDPNGVRGVLDDLVLSQIVSFEAAALQMDLPSDAIKESVTERLRVLSEKAKEAGAPDLETFVRSALGLDPEVLLRELERDAAVDLLASRCVRAWMLSSERREIRAIAVEDEAGSREVQARLDKGEDFGDVARDLSLDRSKDDGGRMPPVVRGDQPISRTAFATALGEVAGPIEDGQGFVFVKVDGAPEPLEGGWDKIGEAVEASIAEREVEDVEFWQWKDAMYTRYEIDISPFLDLAKR